MHEELTLAEIVATLPVRPVNGHKGTFGHLVALVGSRGFTGAAKLVCNAACRSGVGLVTAAIPETLSNPIAASLVEPMTLSLSATAADTIAYEALDSLVSFIENKSALALGPGLSTHPSTARLVRKLYALRPVPMVVDADGLNAFAGAANRLAPRRQDGQGVDAILTPHPGEMSRLTGLATATIQQDRVAVASRYAVAWQATLVLKGHGTIVASPDGRSRRCPTGNHGMSTGGSGDVLTGIIGALLAQGLDAFSAACVGVFVHGLAGDIAAREKTERALIAGDIIESLPQAWHQLERTGV